jgi:hypothetical protein
MTANMTTLHELHNVASYLSVDNAHCLLLNLYTERKFRETNVRGTTYKSGKSGRLEIPDDNAFCQA